VVGMSITCHEGRRRAPIRALHPAANDGLVTPVGAEDAVDGAGGAEQLATSGWGWLPAPCSRTGWAWCMAVSLRCLPRSLPRATAAPPWARMRRGSTLNAAKGGEDVEEHHAHRVGRVVPPRKSRMPRATRVSPMNRAWRADRGASQSSFGMTRANAPMARRGRRRGARGHPQRELPGGASVEAWTRRCNGRERGTWAGPLRSGMRAWTDNGQTHDDPLDGGRDV
jgi:hypothetical protein